MHLLGVGVFVPPLNLSFGLVVHQRCPTSRGDGVEVARGAYIPLHTTHARCVCECVCVCARVSVSLCVSPRRRRVRLCVMLLKAQRGG